MHPVTGSHLVLLPSPWRERGTGTGHLRNRTATGWTVTLLNPAGQLKPQQGILPTDTRENRAITSKARVPIKTARDRPSPVARGVPCRPRFELSPGEQAQAKYRHDLMKKLRRPASSPFGRVGGAQEPIPHTPGLFWQGADRPGGSRRASGR